ncbi:MAG: radical SAM protein [Candidatus Lokiarchaeota archaeon]|nr:radical SAM protein [Candidatus Lokiarchaeota archaeon]
MSRVKTEKLKEIFELKTDLLLHGLRISESFYRTMKKRGNDFYKGRKGGAGPAGGRYFLFLNGSVANVSLYGHKSEQSHLILEKVLEEDKSHPRYLYVEIVDNLSNKHFTDIRLIPEREKYNQMDNLENTINKQIALIHADSVLATTIVQTCKYWREGKPCKFCGIELSLKNRNTIKRKSAEQLIKAIKDAKEQGLCKHVTLTSGTLDTPQKGAKMYIEVVHKIKDIFPDLPIHIQIEPFEDKSLLQTLKEVGVDTIGIHLEIPDDEIRREICPGKARIPRSEFEEYWKESVSVFGHGQVSSFILVGFGEDIDQLIQYLGKMISLGVIPVIVPVRENINTSITSEITTSQMLNIYTATAKHLIKNNLDPLQTKAGCPLCGGCSALNDAYKYIQSQGNNIK